MAIYIALVSIAFSIGNIGWLLLVAGPRLDAAISRNEELIRRLDRGGR